MTAECDPASGRAGGTNHKETPMSETKTLDRPWGTLTYDVHGDDTLRPPLLLIGSPMGASGFPTLASHFGDRFVVTYDPRGVERSVRTDGTGPLTPEDHADDLAILIESLGAGPVELFASSGGAVNALALVAARPDLVSTVVAHEPPLVSITEDAEFATAATTRVSDAYHSSGFGAGMAGFMALVSHQGLFTAADLEQPLPDPAMFGMPTEDDGERGDALLGQNMLSSTGYAPDVEALRAASTRIVIAVGEESQGELARRGGEAVAALLGLTPVEFPSNHGGFLGDEYGMPGKPAEFAAALRATLEE